MTQKTVSSRPEIHARTNPEGIIPEKQYLFSKRDLRLGAILFVCCLGIIGLRVLQEMKDAPYMLVALALILLAYGRIKQEETQR